jgi:hypothetical protein
MRKLTVILCLTLAVLLGSAGCKTITDTSSSGGYQKGRDAHKREDFATALRDWKLATEQGNKEAQISLGLMYFRGQGVPRDRTVAFKWIKKSAEQGFYLAQGFLGSMYENGGGTESDKVYAHMWYSISVLNGNKSKKEDIEYLGRRMTRLQIEIAKDLARECIEKTIRSVVHPFFIKTPHRVMKKSA